MNGKSFTYIYLLNYPVLVRGNAVFDRVVFFGGEKIRKTQDTQKRKIHIDLQGRPQWNPYIFGHLWKVKFTPVITIYTQVWGYPVYYKKRRVTPHKQDKSKSTKTFLTWANASRNEGCNRPWEEGTNYDYVSKTILQLYTTLLYIEGRLIELPLRED